MDILMHRYGRDGRFIESFNSHSDVDVKLEDLKPPKWCVFAKLLPLPKYDEATEVPVIKDGAWAVRKKAFYERPDGNNEWNEELGEWVAIVIPEREPSILDKDNLVEIIVALKDNVEKGTAIPTEIATLVEAERVKLVEEVVAK